jgi:hypothetical protein
MVPVSTVIFLCAMCALIGGWIGIMLIASVNFVRSNAECQECQDRMVQEHNDRAWFEIEESPDANTTN